MRPLIDIKEVAERLGKPVATLRQWRHRGYGPPSMKVGGSVRYPLDELDAWLAALPVAGNPARKSNPEAVAYFIDQAVAQGFPRYITDPAILAELANDLRPVKPLPEPG